MQNSPDVKRDSRTTFLETIGGEPLAGSDFEMEEPDDGFSVTEGAIQE